MQLRTARLCLDCEEVHDEGQCPVCASETFTYLSRWIPSDERRRRPRVEAAEAAIRSPEPPSRAPGEIDAYRRLATGDVPPPRGRQLLKKGVMGLAAVGVVGLLWGRKDAGQPKTPKAGELSRPRLRFYIKMRACALPDLPGRSALPCCLSRSPVRLSAPLARPARSRAPRRASVSTAKSCRSSRTTASPVTAPTRSKRETKFHFDTAGRRVREEAASSSRATRRTACWSSASPTPIPNERMPPPDSGHALTPQADRSAAPMDRRRREVGHALGVRRRRSVPSSRRSITRATGCAIRSTSSSSRGSSARGCSRRRKPTRRRCCAGVTYDLTGTAADAGRDRRLPGRPVAGRLREARRRAAAVAALRRAHGGAVARRGALRRHARLSHRQPARDVAVARLGDRRVQPEHAVRRVRDRAARRRPAAERHARTEDRLRVQPQSHDQLRRRRDRRRVPGRIRHRSRRGDLERVHGPDDGLRAVPLAQVRSRSRTRSSTSSSRSSTPCPELGLDGRTGNAVPVLPLPSPEQQARSTSSTPRSTTREAALDDAIVAPLQARVGSRRCRTRAGEPDATGWSRTTSSTATSPTSPAVTSTAAPSPAIRPSMPARSAGRPRSTATPRSASATSARSIARDPFSLAVWLKGRGNLPMSVFQKLDDGMRRRGYEWRLRRHRARRHSALGGAADDQRWRPTPAQRDPDPHAASGCASATGITSALTYDGSGKAAGLRILRRTASGSTSTSSATRSTGPLATDAPLRVGQQGAGQAVRRPARRPAPLQPRPDAASRSSSSPSTTRSRVIVSGVHGKRSKDEAEQVREYFLTYAAPEALRTAARRAEGAQSSRKTISTQPIPTAMVMAEMKKPRDTFVLARGDYRNQTEKVQPGVPAMLPPLPDGRAAQPADAGAMARRSRTIR